LHKNGPRWTALVVLLLIEKRLAAAERQQAARGLLCMRVVGFRIQVLLNPSSLSLSTSQFIELPPLLLFYRRLAGRPSRITQERDALARECFDPAQHLLSLLFAIELETTPKERKYSATLSFVFALSRLAIQICNLGECSLFIREKAAFCGFRASLTPIILLNVCRDER
jgi:hypothetical protein